MKITFEIKHKFRLLNMNKFTKRFTIKKTRLYNIKLQLTKRNYFPYKFEKPFPH